MSGSSPKSAVVLHADDDVAVLVSSISAGEAVITKGALEGLVLHPRHQLVAGHKIALADLETGRHVRKYGEVIGRLTAPVLAGDHVHVHNLVSLRATESRRGDVAPGEL
jgi:altronate hydrolase/altronate dehydratase small subunit